MALVAFPRPYWPQSGPLPPWATYGQPTSLYFGNATSNRIEVANPSSLVTTIPASTRIILARADTLNTAQAFIFRSVTGGSGGSLNGFNITGGNTLQCFIERATTNATAAQALSSFATWMGVGYWHSFVATCDLAGAATDFKLYIGNEHRPPVEPSSYTVQRVGAGTQATDTGTLYLGNNVATTQGFRGQIASLKIFNRVLTYGEILDEAASLLPIVPGCVLFRLPGASGLAVCPEYAANGSGLGVVTGATLSPFFPQKPLWANARGVWDLNAAATGRIFALAGDGGGLVGRMRGLVA